MWPVATLLRRIPVIGYRLNWRLLVPDYTALALDPHLLKEWAYLDCLMPSGPSTTNLRPDDGQDVVHQAGLRDVVVKRGYNGIEIHGTAPVAARVLR